MESSAHFCSVFLSSELVILGNSPSGHAQSEVIVAQDKFESRVKFESILSISFFLFYDIV